MANIDINSPVDLTGIQEFLERFGVEFQRPSLQRFNPPKETDVEEEEKKKKDEEDERFIKTRDYDPADDVTGYGRGGSVDPTGADHLGAGSLLDTIDSVTGGALSAAHNAGVDEIGGLAATGKGASGWATPSYGNVGSSFSGDSLDGGDMASGAGSVDATGGWGVGDDETGGGWDSTGGFDAGEDGSADDGDDGGFDGGLGYKHGGFTGHGEDNVFQPDMEAGTVHEGEFVVSSDMLEDNPGLMEYLDGLKKKTGEEIIL